MKNTNRKVVATTTKKIVANSFANFAGIRRTSGGPGYQAKGAKLVEFETLNGYYTREQYNRITYCSGAEDFEYVKDEANDTFTYKKKSRKARTIKKGRISIYNNTADLFDTYSALNIIGVKSIDFEKNVYEFYVMTDRDLFEVYTCDDKQVLKSEVIEYNDLPKLLQLKSEGRKYNRM